MKYRSTLATADKVRLRSLALAAPIPRTGQWRVIYRRSGSVGWVLLAIVTPSLVSAAMAGATGRLVVAITESGNVVAERAEP